MKKLSFLLGSAGILAATTLGAGIFALPYAFKVSGWALGLFYLVAIGIIVLFVQWLYGETLMRTGEHHRLLGLVRKTFSKKVFPWAFVGIIGGLLLDLVVYLILARGFWALAAPGAQGGDVVLWIAGSLPLFIGLRWFVSLESIGTLLMVGIIALVFVSSDTTAFTRFDPVSFKDWFLPFGPVLFSLAGWTAVAPMIRFAKEKRAGRAALFMSSLLGLGAVVILYALFVLGIFGSTGVITSDTISGLFTWPSGKLAALGWLGLFAIWTSYVPIALEIRNSLSDDVGVPKIMSAAIAIIVPPLLLSLGLKSFFVVISVAGGIFLSLQYIFILLVSERTLSLSGIKRGAASFALALFGIALIYELSYFVLH